MIPWVRNLSKEFLQAFFLRKNFMWRLPGNVNSAIGLTFDDGPDPDYTPAILDLLARYDVKATFFVIGNNVKRHPQLAREIERQGHAIGGHTQTHCVIVNLPHQQLEEELEHCRATIQDATGIDTRLFRPPRGQVSFSSVRKVAQLGYRLVHWSKTFSDYKCDSTQALLNRIQHVPVRNRDILLFHDTNLHTVEALSTAIPHWQSSGFEFHRL
jgi:peptidoglycan/xylan/chitin deacetylase (PgdA/CDA1 family)